jgi:hypothetical protein
MAQVSLQGAHDQGMSFGKEQKNSVGTSRISEQTASQIPLYKQNAKQSDGYEGGFGDMVNIGVGRITESRAYSPGSCDKEGFDPEQAAKSVMGPQKWAALSAAQRQRAIEDQIAYFDQECEGINFLAGEYKMRNRAEIPPGDDLANWTPPAGTPDENGNCTIKEVTIPPEFVSELCYESRTIEKRECFETANVNVYMEPGLPDKDVYIVLNAKTPTWRLTFHPSKLTVSIIADGLCPLISNTPECPFGSAFEKPTINLGTMSMNGGRSGLIPYGDEYHRIESDPTGDGCTFRLNSRHVSGGAGPGDVHAYWTLNLCEPIPHVNVTWQDNCAILEAATDLPN